MPYYGRKRLQQLLLVLAVCIPCTGTLASQGVSEDALKSALLLKLTRFVYFPEAHSVQQPRLCILGQTPFEDTLNTLNLATPAELQMLLEYPADAGAALDCQFVFISRSERRRLGPILEQLASRTLVTISDIHDFAHNGGMVELALESSRDTQISIVINRRAAAAQGIEFNAQLLRLATLVKE